MILSTKVYRLEEDFYDFALAHFSAVKKSVAAQRAKDNNYYVFEKVRQVRSGAAGALWYRETNPFDPVYVPLYDVPVPLPFRAPALLF